ncbi:MAG: site-specific integrase [Candidatus Sericytochromatia bacterium]
MDTFGTGAVWPAPGEIAGLRWIDIDFDAGTLTVARSRVEVGTTSTVVENEPKTAAARRTLPLDNGLLAVLRRAWARYAQEKLALGAAHADSGYVASTEAGHPYTPGALTHMWHDLAFSAGVRRIRLHDARHSCGTALHLRGVPLAVIAKWLGHCRPFDHGEDIRALSGRRSARSREEFGRSCDIVVTPSACDASNAELPLRCNAGHKPYLVVRRQGFEPRTR